jgi:hypothetical protein
VSPDHTHKTNQPDSQLVSLKLPRLNLENLRCVKCVEHSCSLLSNIPGNIPCSLCIILHARIQARMQDYLVMTSHSTRHETWRYHYRDCASIHYGRKSNLDQRIRCQNCRSFHLWPCFRPMGCHEATWPSKLPHSSLWDGEVDE